MCLYIYIYIPYADTFACSSTVIQETNLQSSRTDQVVQITSQFHHPNTISTTIDKTNAAHVTVCRNEVIPGLRCLVALSRLLDDQNQRGIVVAQCCESFHDMTCLSKIVLNYFACNLKAERANMEVW